MRLSWTLFVSTVSIAVATSHVSSYDERKYGCLIAPEICTPPENCDGLTGNCQVPYRKNYWKYGDTPSKLVKAIRDLESLGYDVDQDDMARVLLARQESDIDDEHYASMGDSRRLRRLVAAITGPDTTHEFRRSVPMAAIENGQGVLVHRETGNPERETLMTADNERLQHMKRLVDEAKQALTQKGKTFSDLTPDEVQSLASFLAKLLVKDEEDQEKIQKSINDNFNQIDSFEENTGGANSDESADKKDVAEENIEEFLEEPINEEARDFNNNVENPKTADTASSDLPKQQTSKVNKSSSTKNSTLYVVIIVVGSTVLLIILVTIISCIVYTYRIKKDENKKFIGQVAGNDAEPFGDDYQELCRQHYASKNSELNDNHKEIIDDGSTAQDPLITRTYPLTKPTGNGPEAKHLDTASLSSHANATRNSSVSSVSWSEEPVTANLDITTGHAVLSYMEDHLNNKDRLDREWEEICGYEADSITTAAAITPQNSRKNRSVVALPYDHNRIKLNPQKNHLQSDYINASAIIDNDPKRPLYIAAQGPLPSTIPDFWQMMWEQGCVAIVMLTPLVEEGVNQCARYWPDEGSCTYHDFEIHLVSEHIWCEDYLVRSLYLKHLGTGETRTVTQFHFLSWPKDRVPSTPKPLLELRRKVTKCYKGHNSPVLVHCSDGVGRTGTYILLDLAIDRMLKGAKEIDIAATLEHIRDQRVGMVAKKEQFEFALTAVAEEVNAILKTLLH